MTEEYFNPANNANERVEGSNGAAKVDLATELVNEACVASGTVAADTQVVSGACWLFGYSVEVYLAGASVTLHNGTSNSDPKVYQSPAVAEAAATPSGLAVGKIYSFPAPIYCPDGLWCEVVSGILGLNFYYKAAV